MLAALEIPTVAHRLQGIFERPSGDADVFCFFFQTMHTTDAGAVATAQVQVYKFSAAAGRWKIFG